MGLLNTEQPKLIILDDDAEFRGMLRQYLSEQGFEVQAVATAEQLDGHLQHKNYDVLILDLMMPGEDGLMVCRRMRMMGQTIPILMLTARGDPVDRIVGLEMGADDYLPKPFNPRELTARLHAICRRQRMLHNSATWGNDEVTDFGPFKLDVPSMELRRGNKLIPLSNSEFQLLRVFAANSKRPMSRDHLLEKIKGRDHAAMDRSVDVLVLRLRRKLEAASGDPRYIRTVRGIGYIFVPEGGDGARGN